MDSKWAITPFKQFAYPFKWKTKIVNGRATSQNGLHNP